MPKPLLVTLEDTKRLIGVKDVLEVAEDVFRMQARDTVTWSDPPRLTIHGKQQSIYSFVKSCVLEEVPIMGVRVVAYYIHPDGSGTSSPESTRYVMLIDPKTGRLLAMVDEHWNYSLRTTASAVIGAKYLANHDVDTVGVVGAGNLARAGLRALCEIFPVKRARVTSRRQSSYEKFASEMSNSLHISVEPQVSGEQVCREAGIILIATTAKKPLVKERWVEPGACVLSLGDDEVEHALYGKVDKVVLDTLDVLHSLRTVIEEGHMRNEDVYALIHEVVAGLKPGRERNDERVVIRTEGLVSQDVAVAYRAYTKAVASGSTQFLES